tara:strand:+ start:4947 stop:5345 length:399 start_codon:yes stop_codon:yes gene_type:complete
MLKWYKTDFNVLRILDKIVILTILFLLTSCGVKQMEFEKSKWNERFDGFYEYRENMVQDLMENHLEKGMEFKRVIELLGEPGNYQNKKENEITYEIMVDYGWNIDPMEGKELYIEFDKDSTVTNFKLKHWKH